MKTFKSFSLLVVLCLLVVGTIWAQEPLTVKIYATDGLKNDSLLLGIDVSGTNSIDGSLGEYELPPEPPTFDVRSKSYPGYSSVGLGVRTDYHKLTLPTQTDKWKIGFISDEAGSEVTFSWDNTGLGVSGGYWMLTELDGTPLCDMTTHTNYTYHTFDVSAQYILLWRGDGAAFLTAPAESLALAHDSKNKIGKYEKWKPVNLFFRFQLSVPVQGTEGLALALDFGAEATGAAFTDLQYIPFTTYKKKITINWGPGLDSGTIVTIEGVARKGKFTKMKKAWGSNKANEINEWDYRWIGYEMPNWNNIGEQLYVAKYPKGPKYNGIIGGVTDTMGLIPGKTKPFFRFVYHPKWKDVTKTLVKASKTVVYTHKGGNPYCLLEDAKVPPKPILKGIKAYPPDGKKYPPNELLAELLAMEFNIYASDYGWMGPTGTGFGKLLFNPPDETYPAWSDGISIDSIVKVADRYLSCDSGIYFPVTGTQLLKVISKVNSSFATQFDTASWGGVEVILKPAKNLAQVTELYRPDWSSPAPLPRNDFDYTADPLMFSLDQNYPNPFNPTTTIAFELPEDAMVTLKIYNLLGQEVETLINQEEFTEGTNEVPFDASRFASGVYYYRLIVNDGQFQQVKKMMLLK